MPRRDAPRRTEALASEVHAAWLLRRAPANTEGADPLDAPLCPADDGRKELFHNSCDAATDASRKTRLRTLYCVSALLQLGGGAVVCSEATDGLPLTVLCLLDAYMPSVSRMSGMTELGTSMTLSSLRAFGSALRGRCMKVMPSSSPEALLRALDGRALPGRLRGVW